MQTKKKMAKTHLFDGAGGRRGHIHKKDIPTDVFSDASAAVAAATSVAAFLVADVTFVDVRCVSFPVSYTYCFIAPAGVVLAAIVQEHVYAVWKL